PHSKSSKTILSVKFPNGKTISNRFASETFVETIEEIGVERIRGLDILCCGVPLVSNTKDDFYNQREIKNGIFIMTHSSTRTKKDQLDEISKKLGLSIKTAII